MKGPDPRQISCHHDRYGNFVGHSSNIVTDASIQKEKYALDAIDFREIYDEKQGPAGLVMVPLGYLVTVKRGDKSGKALDWYLEDAAAAAVANMENGNDLAGERIPVVQDIVGCMRKNLAENVAAEAVRMEKNKLWLPLFLYVLMAIFYACGFFSGMLVYWLLRR